jgi:hypothetical protein
MTFDLDLNYKTEPINEDTIKIRALVQERSNCRSVLNESGVFNSKNYPINH